MALDPQQARDVAGEVLPLIVGGIGGLSGFLYVVLEKEREFRLAVGLLCIVIGAVFGGLGLQIFLGPDTKGFLFWVWIVGSIAYPLYGKGRVLLIDGIMAWLRAAIARFLGPPPRAPDPPQDKH